MEDNSFYRKKAKQQLFGGILIALASLLVLGIMVYIFVSAKQKESFMDAQTTSTDVEITLGEDSDGDTLYSPIYTFEVDGKEYKCDTNYSSSSNPGTENQTIYYESANPSNCTFDYAKKANTIILLFTPLPIIGVIAGISIAYDSKKTLRATENTTIIAPPTSTPPTPPSNNSSSNPETPQSDNPTPILG